jgi:hypothetical protein
VRERWERLAAAARRGEPIPPIDVRRVGDLHFVSDGHHRVSVARALGRKEIEARVTVVETAVDPSGIRGRGDLLAKDHRRVFLERAPLAGAAREAVRLREPWDYALLGEHVEAWGFRLMQQEGALLDRAAVARRWFDEEYQPVVAMLADADLIGEDDTDAEAYLRLAGERYRLLRKHTWDDEVIAALRGD